MRKKTVGLFGGTFNPVHNGHISLARWLVDHGRADEVWLSLSPHNPLKSPAHPGADDSDRARMLALACEGLTACRPCLLESEMPRPSYTIRFLEYLSDRFTDSRFIPVIGADNWITFPSWHRGGDILSRYGVMIYPRPGYDPDPATLPHTAVYLSEAPVADISSSAIRALLAARDPSALGMVPKAVADYIRQNNLYS